MPAAAEAAAAAVCQQQQKQRHASSRGGGRTATGTCTRRPYRCDRDSLPVCAPPASSPSSQLSSPVLLAAPRERSLPLRDMIRSSPSDSVRPRSPRPPTCGREASNCEQVQALKQRAHGLVGARCVPVGAKDGRIGWGGGPPGDPGPCACREGVGDPRGAPGPAQSSRRV